MKNFLLVLAFIYGAGMAVYGSVWYVKDIRQLEKAVATNNYEVEMRHRINTWGNVGTILFANLISTVAIAGINTSVTNKKDSNPETLPKS
jgi:hypothetical protein